MTVSVVTTVFCGKIFFQNLHVISSDFTAYDGKSFLLCSVLSTWLLLDYDFDSVVCKLDVQ